MLLQRVNTLLTGFVWYRPRASEKGGQGQRVQHREALNPTVAAPAASETASETESSGLEPASSGPSSGLGLQLWQIQQRRAEQLQSEASGPEARPRLRKSFSAGWVALQDILKLGAKGMVIHAASHQSKLMVLTCVQSHELA